MLTLTFHKKKSSLSDNHDSFMTSTPKESPRKNKLEMSIVNWNRSDGLDRAVVGSNQCLAQGV